MTWRRRLATLVTVLLFVAAGGGGAALGLRLGHVASAPQVRRLALTAPDASGGSATGALISAGGFTGFGGAPALGGEVVQAGAVQTADANSIVVGDGAAALTMRFTAPTRFFELAMASRGLQVGDVVQLHVRAGDAVAALRLPAGLDQGGNR